MYSGAQTLGRVSAQFEPDFGLGPLADPALFHQPVDLSEIPREMAGRMLEAMLQIRLVEETVAEMVESGEVRCPCHLTIGQEAAAVGIEFALDGERDRVFGAHRSHGHYLSLGGDPAALFAEVLGKDTGCSRGMGGSMHLAAPELGLMGTVPIVGATIPIAVGAAMALKMDGLGGAAVAHFGDGAAEEGVFHESLNLAAVRKLPVIFACENNLFSSHLHIGLRQPSDRVSRFAEAHQIPHELVDGNDVAAVYAAAVRAVERAREERSPSFIEMATYRWRGHVGHREDLDVGVKRGEELPLWKRRDPIRRLREGLLEVELETEESCEAMSCRVAEEVASALATAREAPFPPADAMERYLYARRDG